MDIEPIDGSPRRADETIDDDWGAVVLTIALDEDRFGPEAVAGRDGFSHLEMVFARDRVEDDQIHCGARHPRGNPDWPEVGIPSGLRTNPTASG